MNPIDSSIKLDPEAGLVNKLNSAIYILLRLSALGRHYDRNFQILSKNFRPFFFLSKQNMIQYAKRGYFLIEKKGISIQF